MWPAACDTVDSMQKNFRLYWGKVKGALSGWGAVYATLFFLLTCLLFSAVTTPSFGLVSYQFIGRATHTGELPLFVETEGDTMLLAVNVTLGSIHPTRYLIKADNCLQSLRVNGMVVDERIVKFCDYTVGKVLNLGPYLHGGLNDLRFIVHDDGGKGGIDITASHQDSLVLGEQILFIILLGLLVFLTSRRLFWSGSLAWIFYGGVFLRYWYLLSTPHYLRGYDTDGHIEYIHYVADHFRIPLISQGWEFYQPPLYYFLTAPIVKIEEWLGHSAAIVNGNLQLFSLLISVGILGIGFWIGSLLFPSKRQRPTFLLYASLIATCPGIVYLSSRINNDILVQFLSFLFLALILRWWLRGNRRDWFLAFLVLALGILTKSNALPLIGVAWLALLVRRIPWREKLTLFALSFGMTLLLTDWLFLIRLLSDRNVAMVGNAGNLNGALLLQNSFSHLLGFDPLYVLRHPFNNPWNDDEGRQFFLQYLFRSAFFGEFMFDRILFLGRSIMLFALISLPLALLGFVRDATSRFYERLPLLLTPLLLLAAHAAFRLHFPFAPSQDFRYVVLAALPLFAFAAEGAFALPRRLRHLAVTALAALSVLCSVFLGYLFFIS